MGADLRNLVQQTVYRLRVQGQISGNISRNLLPTISTRGRPTITVDDVDATTGARLQVPADALITPAAQDRARERGIEITCTPLTAGESPLGPEEEALIETLTRQLAADISGQTEDEIACWCRTDCLTKCADRVATIANAGADRIGLEVSTPPSSDAIASLIDHTLLKP